MNKVLLGIGLALGLMGNSALAQLKYVEGRDYQPLAAAIEEVDEPKVIEFFWYGCSHCYNVYAPLHDWIANDKPETINIETVPAIPSERWAIAGHLYYTAEALDLDISDKVFKEVHDKGNAGIIFDEDKAKAFLVSQGVDMEKVEKAWSSFGVKQAMDRATKLFVESGLEGVPSFVVNGVYEVPFKGDFEEFFPRLEAITNIKAAD